MHIVKRKLKSVKEGIVKMLLKVSQLFQKNIVVKVGDLKLQVLRFSSENDSTNGLLFDTTDTPKFLAYTLEDEYREEKVYAETRIPEGTYKITLRTVGGLHKKYNKRFPDIHKGMLWVRDVKNFKWILIHCGNTDDHTAGCLLVGDSQHNNQTKKDGFIGSSSKAYKRIYPYIAKALEDGKEVTIQYTNHKN